jgi:acetolactate synthase-1/2/3 large subunit
MEIRPALERAFASGLPACLNVMTDPSQPHMTSIAMATGNADSGEVDLPYYGKKKLLPSM